MSILIKGMEMPESCEDCDLCTSDGYCIAMGDDSLWDVLPEGAEYFPTGWKYEGCPLVEVPAPHGRLIDYDWVVENVIKKLGIKDKQYLLQAEKALMILVDEAPTVIEAEVTE